MTTYATMQARIADELARSDLTAQIAKSIQSAIKKYERRRLYFNTKTANMTTVADQEYYDSSDMADIPYIAEILSATVTSGTSVAPLQRRDMVYIDNVSRDSAGSSDPRGYAYEASQIRLYPVPSAALTTTWTYVYRFTALSADADTNAWMTDAEELIRCQAKADLFAHVIRDPNEMGLQLQWADAALRDLMRETRLRSSSGRLALNFPTLSNSSRFASYTA